MSIKRLFRYFSPNGGVGRARRPKKRGGRDTTACTARKLRIEQFEERQLLSINAWGIDGDGILYDVDTETGMATDPRDTGLGADSTVGIAADSTGLLYTLTGSTATDPDALYTIDAASGAATRVGSTGVTVSDTGDADLDFDPTTGVLYGVSNDSVAGTVELFTVDVDTGAASVVAPIAVDASVSSMAFDVGGQLYLRADGPDALYEVDKATGDVLSTTPLRWLGVQADFDGGAIDFGPEDGTLYAADGGDHIIPGTNTLFTASTYTGNLTEVGTTTLGDGLTGLEFRPLDLGDAADTPYATLLANDGARHAIEPGLFLGSVIDAEADGQPNARMTGDDLNGLDDEDGVVFTTPVRCGLSANVTAISSAEARLDAWIDFDGDGVWEEDERIFDSEPLEAGENDLSFQIPETATIGSTAARFRSSSAGGLDPTGLALDGEVEDYAVRIIGSQSIVLELVQVVPNGDDLIEDGEVLNVAPDELVFYFNEGRTVDPNSLGGIQIVRSGGDGIIGDGDDVVVEYGWIGIGDEPNEVIVRFSETLPDDLYRINLIGSGASPLRDVDGYLFRGGLDGRLEFELDLGAQVVAVVPQPVTRDGTGALQQEKNKIVVYFNDDELDAGLATDPRYYALFDTNDTLATDDDTMLLPASVVYDAAENTAVLEFDDVLPEGTFRLQVGSSDESNETLATAVSVGALFDTTDYSQVAFIGDEDGNNDVDLYRIEIAENNTELIIDVTPDADLDPVIRLFRAAGGEEDIVNDEGVGDAESLSVTLDAGTYYVGVSSADNDDYDPTDGSGNADGTTSGSYLIELEVDKAIDGDDDNSSFETATDLGTLGAAGQQLSSQIEPQDWILMPRYAGGSDEPGHRDIPAEAHGAGSGTTSVAPDAIGTVTYSFPLTYGSDPQGNILYNQINDAQKERTREIFEMFASLFGFEVYEVASGGIRVVTGDIRAVNASYPPDAVGGISGGGIVVMNALFYGDPAKDVFGGAWMGTALHELGHSIGLGHCYEVRGVMGAGMEGEDTYPAQIDIIHSQRNWRPDATDIDMYQFTVDEAGLFTAETVAERLSNYSGQDSSLLNTVLRLYREEDDGSRTLIAQNDDYYSNDSYIELALKPGTYYVGVSSTGNADYDPSIPDSGYGGLTDGDYELKLGFAVEPSSSLADATGTILDGDLDGEAGGAYEFSFRSNTADNTIFVDKTAITNLKQALTASSGNRTVRVDDVGVLDVQVDVTVIKIDREEMLVTAVDTTTNVLTVTRGYHGTTIASHAEDAPVRLAAEDGSLAAPYGLISSALDAASAGDVIRIVGNGGADDDVSTVDDNRAYLVGLDAVGMPLEDGSLFDIPADVVVQIDAGAMVKLHSAVIDAGTSDPLIDRSGGALQVLGTPDCHVLFTSYADDSIGGDSNQSVVQPAAGDWGGLVFREDSDFQEPGAAWDDPGIFLNYVNQAELRYGGGSVEVGSVESVYASIHLDTTRPTITNNLITLSADAAVSANPDAFADSRGRIGPTIRGNTVVDNSINGVFVRVGLESGEVEERLSVSARFDDTDIVHVVTESVEIVGNAGGPMQAGSQLVARQSGRLMVDPGVVVKLGASRIEALRGNAHLIAEGTDANPVIFTSLYDDRYGAGGTFDTSNNGSVNGPTKGDWGGLIFNANSRGSIDHALIAYGGGATPIAGGFANFSTIEVHHNAHVRLANSTLTDNDDRATGGNRDDRGSNDNSLIFVRQAQPIIVNNVFENNDGNVISINANAMLYTSLRDTGRSTGAIDAFDEFADNQGPLVRLNRMAGNGTNGMNVRAGTLTTECVWDDTDVVHVLRGEIDVDQHHTYSGLRLESAVDQSLVVKLGGGSAGFTADGIPLDIDDRIGGTIQIVGQPEFPVVLTSLADDSIGASFDPDGNPQLDTNNNGPSTGAPGDWRSLLFEKYSNDRNVRVVLEPESPATQGDDLNYTPALATYLGRLAPDEKSGDENNALGFEVHGYISGDDPGDVDVYSFEAEAGTEVWIDVDRTRGALDTVVELVRSDGALLARSTVGDVYPDDPNAVITGSPTTNPSVLAKDSYNGGDYYTQNYMDAGFRVVLPGTIGKLGTYYVRVRSESPDLDVLHGGLTSGEYQLQLRLQQRDEKPGSTVRHADVRYATTGIDVRGLPAHSPLLGESEETNAANHNPEEAQNFGNLLESDQNVISVSGELTNSSDVDFYRFNVDYARTELGPSIQAIAGVNGGGKTWATVFDLDYADGLTRGDTTMIVFDANLTPILIGRESNVIDDQPGAGQGNDLDDLTRGTVGKLDPFIGTVQLPAGIPGSVTDYYVAVSSNGRLITDLNQFYQASATNTEIRLEPINSVQRIIEDHVGFQGYHSNGAQVDPVNTNGLFNISSETQLSTHVREFDLSDVLLYVNTQDTLVAVNPLFGEQVYTIDNNLTSTDQEMQDIVMRSDGQLYGYQRLYNDTTNTAGRLATIDHATGALSTVGNDGVQGESAPYVDGINSDMDDLTISDEVGALTFRRNGPNATDYYEGYYSVYENERDQDGYRNSKLYRFNADTGAIQNGPNDTGYANIQYSGVDYATATLSLSNDSGTTRVQVQARAPGTYGDGITIRVTYVDDGSGASVENVAGRTIYMEVDDGATAQNVVDAINNDDDAKMLVQAARITNNNYTAANSITLVATTDNGQNDSTMGEIGVIEGNVTGLAFDSFTGGTLYGITDEGEFLEINRSNGAATLIYDFEADPQGLDVGKDFQGLSLGPQNLHDGLFQNTFFAITSTGNMVAFKFEDGVFTTVDAFGSDNEVQTLQLLGMPSGSGTFRLTFSSAQFGADTTDPIPFDATPAEVESALEALTTAGGVPLIASGDVVASMVSGDNLAEGNMTIEFTGFFQDKDVLQLAVDNSGMTTGFVVTSTLSQGADGLRDDYDVNTGISGVTGLAFSSLDANLWHPTTNRSSDAGHGVNEAHDLSRTPSNEDCDETDEQGHNYNLNEAQGGVSFYFGLEDYVDSNTNPYLNYQASRTQLGIVDNEVQRDLTSTGTIGGNYDLPGGAYGSLITDPFDLVSDTGTQDPDDRPTLYFNYWLQTEGANTANPTGGDMKDSARVFISSDGGRTWNLLATNNTPRNFVLNTTELPGFASHSRYADPGDPRQDVQELYETSNWRQARVDLSDYVGRTDLVLRFDFSTGGTIVDAGLQTRHTDLDTTLDGFGDLEGDGSSGDFQRAQSNSYEGFYVDDIIIGWSERGEMITSASAGATSYFNVPDDPDPEAPQVIEDGLYQVEIRRGFEHAGNISDMDPEIAIATTIDTNDRLIPTGLDSPDQTEDFEPPALDLGWATTLDPGSAPWTVEPDIGVGNSYAAHSAPNLAEPIDNNQVSLMWVTVATGTGNVTFDYRAVIGQGDAFQVFVDEIGENPAEFEHTDPGDTGWHYTVAIPVTAGIHTFYFRYKKDAADPGGTPADQGVTVDNAFFPGIGGRIVGDRNVERDQGIFVIEGNFIRDVANAGIRIEAGSRESRTVEGGIEDGATSSYMPTPGSPINFDTENTDRLAPGVVVQNNVVAGFGSTGIYFAGESNASGGAPAAAVPLGRIVNNTIYGGETATGIGIRVDDYASPDVLNNIVANTATGISIDGTCSSTVVGANLFANNASNGTVGSNEIIVTDPTDPLFVDAAGGNFYLKEGEDRNGNGVLDAGEDENGNGELDLNQAIDSSLNELDARPEVVAVTSALGIAKSPTKSPNEDLYGQLRVDDPTQDPPAGMGSKIFNDRGAIERADFVGPAARVVDPEDNGPLDFSAAQNEVIVVDQNLTQFSIELTDPGGVGVYDNSVVAEAVSVYRVTHIDAFGPDPGDWPAPLTLDTDYLFDYDPINDVIRLVPGDGIWADDAIYVIILDNSSDGVLDLVGIEDLAGNNLEANESDGPFAGMTVFTIQLTGLDYGDAPQDVGYPSLLDEADLDDPTEGGARHLVDGLHYLGSGSTWETDAWQNADATGDTLDDGVTIESALVIGDQGLVTVTASTAGFLNAWIDFNDDGDWDDGGEQIFTDRLLVAGENTGLVVNVADAATVGLGADLDALRFARFRFSTEDGLGVTGYASDGEVEDYVLRLVLYPEDYGDAPDDGGSGTAYPTLRDQEPYPGASHYLDPDGPILGTTVDVDLDGQPHAAAEGDDLDVDGDDEDGVVFGDGSTLPPVLVSSDDEELTVHVTMGASGTAVLDAWIDFNRDGDWDDPGEQVFTDEPLADGDNDLQIDMPDTLTSGLTYARFRVSSAGGLSYYGAADDGEVEDYQVLLTMRPVAYPNGPYNVLEGNSVELNALFPSESYDPDGSIVEYEWDFDYDGSTFDVNATGATADFPAVDGPATYTVALRVTDNNGGQDVETTTVTVHNVAPSVTADNDPVTVDEGQTAANTGSFYDPGDDDVTITASIGAVTQAGTQSGTWEWSLDTTDGPDESTTVTITATDSDGAFTTTTFDLIVDNVPPDVTVDTDPVTVDEGQPATNAGTFSDVGVDDVTVSASIGAVSQDDVAGTWSWSFDTTDGPAESQTVTITATDSDGEFTTTTFDLIVNNVPPGVTVDDDPVAVDEGQTATNTGTFFDVGDDVVTVSASIGSVTQVGTQSGTWNWSFDTTDGPDQTQVVTITATDSDGAVTTTTFNLIVDNVDPVVDADNPSVTVDEAQTAANSGTFSDAGEDDVVTITASIGTVTQVGTDSGTWNWSFDTTDGPDETQTVTITATDSDDAVTTTTFDLVVNNVAPSVDADNASVTVDEAQTAANTGTFSDPGDDDVTITASIGTVTQNGTQAGTWSWSFDTTDGPDETQTVTITATDSDDAVTTTTFELVVNNVAPSVDADNASVTVDEAQTAANTGTFSDPGDDDVTITASIGTVTQDDMAGTWSWSFDTTDGPDETQTVTITATDSDDAVTTTTFELVVNNVAPSVDADSASVTVDEAATAANTGTFFDPGDDDVTITASIGTVTQDDVAGTWSWSFDTIDGPDETQTVTITATDSDDAVTTTTFELVVDNVAPSVGADDASVTVDEAQTAANSGTFFDPGDDDVTITASIGTLTQVGTQAGTWSWSFDTSDGPDETQTVTITATDSDGAVTTTTFDLIVDNVAPSVAADDSSVTVAESQTATNTGTFSDVGVDDVTITASVGAVSQDDVAGTWSWSFDSTDGPDESQTVTITATDSDGAFTTTTFDLTVVNVAPEVGADNASVTVDEAQTAANTGTFSDVGVDDVTIAASVGAVSQDDVAGTWSWSFDTTDGPDETQTVTITATDSDGALTATTFELTVNNVAPQVAADSPLVTVDEAQTAANTGTFSDVGVDDVAITASVGAVSQDDVAGTWSWSFDTTDGPDQNQIVTITATDSDGAVTTADFTLIVNNVAPGVAAYYPSVNVDEGQIAANAGGFWDDGDDIVTLSASIGSITQTGAHSGTWNWSFDTTDGPAEDQTVTITATDSDDAVSTTTFELTVNNVAPTVDAGADQSADEAAIVEFSGSFTDPGTGDTHTITWDFGDGQGASDTLTPTHAYADDGVYQVILTVVDDDGGMGIDTMTVTVANVAPVVEADQPSVTIDEGQTATNTGTFSDVGDDTVTLTASVGTLTQLGTQFGTWGWSFDSTDGPDESQTVTITADDGEGGVTAITFALTVNNVAPTADAGGWYVVDEGTSVTLDASASSDPGDDVLTYLWDLDGDGTFGETGPVAARGDEVGIHPIFSAAALSGPSHVVVTLRVSDELGAATEDTATVWIAQTLGPVDFLEMNDLDPTAGDLWYSVETVRDGFLTLEVVDLGATVTLYDANLNPLTAGGDQRIDYEAAAGEKFFFALSGAAGSVDLRIANLVSQAGTTVDVYGTDGPDNFEFAPTGSRSVTVNGVLYEFPDAESEWIAIHGQGANDTATLTGTGQKETAEFWPDHGELTGVGYRVTTESVETVSIFGGGGDDVARLHDSDQGDTFEAWPNSAMFYGTTFAQTVSDFREIFAFADSGGVDTARLRDSAASKDTFIGLPYYGKMYDGATFWEYAVGFEQITAEATAGTGHQDVAKLIDSDGDDVFDASPGEGTMQYDGSADVFVHAAGFTHLYGYATGEGQDEAHLQDSPHRKDTFIASPGYGKLYDGTNWQYAVGFEEINATATAGMGYADVAKITDSAGDDVFEATPDEGTIKFDGSDDHFVHAAGFKHVYGYSTEGLDTAFFQDSPTQKDTFVGLPDYSRMYHAATYWRYALGFEQVSAASTSGATLGDVAKLVDSAGYDVFDAAPDGGKLKYDGSDDHYVEASGFRYLWGYATEGGIDVATLQDSPDSRDTFLAALDFGKLYGPEFWSCAKGFEQITASATADVGYDDVARLFDSTGNDVFDARPDRGTMKYNGHMDHFAHATGFRYLWGYAHSIGTDEANLYDSPDSKDTFIGDSDYSKMYGPGFWSYADGFEQVNAMATADDGYDDVATLNDSPAADVFEGTPDEGTMKFDGSEDNFIRAANFRFLYAYAAGDGADVANLYDSPDSRDAFIGDPNYAKLFGAGFWMYTAGFGEVTATATADDGFDDRATLYDSYGADALVAGPASAQLTFEDGGFLQADNFRYVEAISWENDGATDTARLIGRPGSRDTFTGTPDYALLAGAAFSNRATQFDAVTAIGTARDGDVANLVGAPTGYDIFEGSATHWLSQPYGKMYGLGYSHELLYFDKIYAEAGAGTNDQAYLWDSKFDDILEATGSTATLSGDDIPFLFGATGFDYVQAESTTQGDGDTVSATTGYLFDLDLEGWWEDQ